MRLSACRDEETLPPLTRGRNWDGKRRKWNQRSWRRETRREQSRPRRRSWRRHDV